MQSSQECPLHPAKPVVGASLHRRHTGDRLLPRLHAELTGVPSASCKACGRGRQTPSSNWRSTPVGSPSASHQVNPGSRPGNSGFPGGVIGSTQARAGPRESSRHNRMPGTTIMTFPRWHPSGTGHGEVIHECVDRGWCHNYCDRRMYHKSLSPVYVLRVLLTSVCAANPPHQCVSYQLTSPCVD